MELNLKTVASLRPSKTFKHAKGPNAPEITSLDFSDTGEFCLTASKSGRQIMLYDSMAGSFKSDIPSKKYGCSIAKFTHKNNNCIHTTSDKNQANDLRYLSLHDNTYIAYFKGHTKTVTALEVSPSSDGFLTASNDNTVRAWDLRDPRTTGKLEIPGPTLVAYDPSGKVFAVACRATTSISIYDAKSQTNGPFLNVQVSCPEDVQWTKVEFSNNDKYILLATSSYVHFIFDAYNGQLLHRLIGHGELPHRTDGAPSSAAFTIDGSFVVGGSSQGHVVIWDVEHATHVETRPVQSITGNSDAQLVAFNPQLFVMASADRELSLWLPAERAA